MRIRLLVSEAWRSLAANASTTFAATMTVFVGMFIIGLFIAVFTWTSSYTNQIKNELIVQVDFKAKATRAQETAVARTLQQNHREVKNVAFVTKQQALIIMRKKYPDLTDQLAWNPFPDALKVTATNANYLGDIAASLQPLPPGVQKLVQGKRLRQAVLSWAHVIDVAFAIGAVVLGIASMLLIGNTIRLSIFSRRREIEVMKLVGATNWFVRGPFMVEGLLCGLAGSLLAIVFLIIGRAVAWPAINFNGFLDVPGVHAWGFQFTALTLLAAGLGLGAMGSGLTVHRFLKV